MLLSRNGSRGRSFSRFLMAGSLSARCSCSHSATEAKHSTHRVFTSARLSFTTYTNSSISCSSNSGIGGVGHHHHHHHFWQAPLRMRSAERRHQSPEWTVLSQVNCIVHIEVAGFQIPLNGFHSCNTTTSQWSRPVSCGGSC